VYEGPYTIYLLDRGWVDGVECVWRRFASGSTGEGGVCRSSRVRVGDLPEATAAAAAMGAWDAVKWTVERVDGAAERTGLLAVRALCLDVTTAAAAAPVELETGAVKRNISPEDDGSCVRCGAVLVVLGRPTGTAPQNWSVASLEAGGFAPGVGRAAADCRRRPGR